MIRQGYLDAIGILATATGGPLSDQIVELTLDLFERLARDYSVAATALDRAEQLQPTGDLVILGRELRESAERYVLALRQKLAAFAGPNRPTLWEGVESRMQATLTDIEDLTKAADKLTFGPDGSMESSPLHALAIELRDLGGSWRTKPGKLADDSLAEHFVGIWLSVVGVPPPVPKSRRGPFMRFVDAAVSGMREVDPTIAELSIYRLKKALTLASSAPVAKSG